MTMFRKWDTYRGRLASGALLVVDPSACQVRIYPDGDPSGMFYQAYTPGWPRPRDLWAVARHGVRCYGAAEVLADIRRVAWADIRRMRRRHQIVEA